MTSAPASGGRLWVRRVGWFIMLWTVSVVALAVVADLLRTLMHFAGLTA